MAREDIQLKFRVPAEMREKLQAAAEENKRSLNAEIIARLEQSLSKIKMSPEVGRAVDVMMKTIERQEALIASLERIDRLHQDQEKAYQLILRILLSHSGMKASDRAEIFKRAAALGLDFAQPLKGD